MRILAIVQGTYGQRIVDNIILNGPDSWKIETWKLPRLLPYIIENPKEILPENLPQSNLILSLGEKSGVAELLPEIARMCSAKAVIAPIDNRDALPPGLVNQIKDELKYLGIESVFPLPFCSLTQNSCNNQFIKEFAQYFGKPKLKIGLNENRVSEIRILREAPCGATRFVKEKILGLSGDEAQNKAALFHQYYPCLASGKLDRQIGDSILHRAAHITTSAVKLAITLYFKEQVTNKG